MTTKDKKRAHLLGFIQHGVNSHATGMWRHPKDKVGWDFSRPEYWQHMARTMERGLFDAVFIADELAPYNTHEDTSDADREMGGAMSDARAVDHRADHHDGDQAPRRRRYSVDGVRASVFDVSPVIEPRPFVERPGRVEHRLFVFEERMGCLRAHHDGSKRAIRAAWTSTWRSVTSFGTPGSRARSSPTRRAAFTQIPRRSGSFITKENITNVMVAIFARRHRKAGRCFGKPALQVRGGTSRQSMPRRFSRFIRISTA